MNNITIGQFLPGNTPLHRMDPRSKLILTVAVIIVIFMSGNALCFATLFAALTAVVISTHIKLKIIARALKPIAIIIILTVLLNMFFTQTGDIIFQWQFIKITAGGVSVAGLLAARLILLVLSTQLLTLTTSPIALTDGLEYLLKPLSKIGFPAHEMAMIMSIALRMIPTLLEETDKIRKAQMARGADFESGNLMKRARAMIPLLVPLFVSAFRRADELALAMEARCYRGGEHRTRMKILRFSAVDAWATGCVAALSAAVFLMR